MNSIVYVGMDVHKESYTLCCYSFNEDKLQYQQKIEPDYKKVLRYSVSQFLNLLYYKRRNVEMPDKTVVCKDCGKEFVFTEGEQAFYKEKGFENEPQRCAECRKARKQRSNNDRGYRK